MAKMVAVESIEASIFLAKPGVKEQSDAILVRAAELLGERGWIRNQAINERGEMCAVGSIRVARQELGIPEESWAETASIVRLKEHVTARFDCPFCDEGIRCDVAHSVPYWNDHIVGGVEDVILAMKRTAADG
jgi:hypothetical protein